MNMWWNGAGHMGLMSLWWILVLGALVALFWFAARAGAAGRRGDESADQILKKRYANGEIDRQTYDRMMADLRR